MKKLLIPVALLAALALWTAPSMHLAAQDAETTFDIQLPGSDDRAFGETEFNFDTDFEEFNEAGEFQPGTQDVAAGAGLLGLFCLLIFWGLCFICAIITIMGMWKTFAKAGQPGWAAIIPFYNYYVLCQVCGKDIVWFILLLVPCVNIVVSILLMIELAKVFGKGAGFAIGLIFLAPIFIAILGFGKAQYLGAKAA